MTVILTNKYADTPLRARQWGEWFDPLLLWEFASTCSGSCLPRHGHHGGTRQNRLKIAHFALIRHGFRVPVKRWSKAYGSGTLG